MQVKVVLDRFVEWLTATQHNLKSLAVLRILYGVALLGLLVPSMADRSLLWGQASFWVDPEARRRGYWTFDTLFTKDSAWVFDVAYFGLILVVLAFIVGWRTRVMTPVLLVLLVSLYSNNPYVLNGGDTLLRLTLLFLVFTNLSEHYSLDARRRKRRSTLPKRLMPHYVGNASHNTGLILSCFQIIVVYTTSGVWKLLGEDWLNGTAVFYALRIDNFMLYPAINELLWQSNVVIYLATFVALWVQTLFVGLILWRPTRIIALIILIFMHLGIGLLLGLWPFSLVMIALDMLFIRDATWQRINDWVQATAVYDRIVTRLKQLRRVGTSTTKEHTTSGV